MLDQTALLIGHNDLILHRMFSYVDVQSLKNCRLVNSRWYENCQPYFKKKSVIELHFHLKEKTPKTPKKFVDLFQAAPLENTFSGVRIISENKHTEIDWIEHPHPSLIDFVSKYGLQLNYFEIQLLDGCYMSYSSIALKKILVDFIPNIEHLRVYSETREGGARRIQQTVPIISNIPDPSPEATKLNKLKKFEWIVLPENWFIDDDDEYSANNQAEVIQNISTPALTDVITYSPNLNSITTEGSVMTLDIFKNLSTEKVSKLKEIFIDPRNSPHPLRPLLIQLTILGNLNLRLESFAVILLEDWGCEVDFCIHLYLPLMQFITTQKDCLKKLRIRLVPKNAHIGGLNDFPAFPKMSKLEQLNLSYENEKSMEVLFGGLTNWSNLFPALKRLDVKYNRNFLQENQILPGLVSKNSVSHNNVQVLKLFPMNSDEDVSVNKCIKVHSTAQKKFPNIKTMEVYDEKKEIMHSYDGNVQNSKSFYYKKREPGVSWGCIVHDASWPSGCFL